MPRLRLVVVCIPGGVLAAACAFGGPSFEPERTGPFGPLAAPNPVFGELTVRISYPPVDGPPAKVGESLTLRARGGYQIQNRDSAFVFGAVGRADAELVVNGRSVPVYPTGGWIAWLPLPNDSVARFDVLATFEDDTARVILEVPVVQPPRSVAGTVWIDSSSFDPAGDRWVRPGEGMRLTLRASPGAEVTAYTVEGDTIRFLPDTITTALPWGQLAFSTDTSEHAVRSTVSDRYFSWWTGEIGPDPEIVMAPGFPTEPTDSTWMFVRAVVGTDTATTRWPLRLGLIDMRNPLVAVVNDDPDSTGSTDEILAGRPSPWGTYHWFFPNGTLAMVSGRWNDQIRLQLSKTSSAWVDAYGLYPLPPRTPPPVGLVRSLRLTNGDHSVTLRIPLTAKVPFLVEEGEKKLSITLYGVAGDIDWIQYGGTEAFVRLVDFSQPEEDETVVTVSLSSRVWGYRTTWSENELQLEIRRPPSIDPRRPLEGRIVAIDAGHPPGGATGPTGTPEAVVNLAVANKVGVLLAQYGAHPILVRDSDAAMGLYERIDVAEHAGAEILVSVHANALPDGVNPFHNNGTSVYYFHPRSVGLARELNRALVRHLGFRDLGIGRGDLALVRPTWMPAALTEGLFLMMPDQEAVLASEEGQWRYARAIVEGVAAYLREWALDG